MPAERERSTEALRERGKSIAHQLLVGSFPEMEQELKQAGMDVFESKNRDYPQPLGPTTVGAVTVKLLEQVFRDDEQIKAHKLNPKKTHSLASEITEILINDPYSVIRELGAHIDFQERIFYRKQLGGPVSARERIDQYARARQQYEENRQITEREVQAQARRQAEEEAARLEELARRTPVTIRLFSHLNTQKSRDNTSAKIQQETQFLPEGSVAGLSFPDLVNQDILDREIEDGKYGHLIESIVSGTMTASQITESIGFARKILIREAEIRIGKARAVAVQILAAAENLSKKHDVNAYTLIVQVEEPWDDLLMQQIQSIIQEKPYIHNTDGDNMFEQREVPKQERAIRAWTLRYIKRNWQMNMQERQAFIAENGPPGELIAKLADYPELVQQLFLGAQMVEFPDGQKLSREMIDTTCAELFIHDFDVLEGITDAVIWKVIAGKYPNDRSVARDWARSLSPGQQLSLLLGPVEKHRLGLLKIRSEEAAASRALERFKVSGRRKPEYAQEVHRLANALVQKQQERQAYEDPITKEKWRQLFARNIEKEYESYLLAERTRRAQHASQIEE